ncbi:hypothetical protein F5X99DRAFT_309962 [Biscogniauxia marginata]|nr:hypothetical protein F5X99DRAFT_309962 [Biscogniauxia marginata]
MGTDLESDLCAKIRLAHLFPPKSAVVGSELLRFEIMQGPHNSMDRQRNAHTNLVTWRFLRLRAYCHTCLKHSIPRAEESRELSELSDRLCPLRLGADERSLKYRWMRWMSTYIAYRVLTRKPVGTEPQKPPLPASLVSPPPPPFDSSLRNGSLRFSRQDTAPSPQRIIQKAHALALFDDFSSGHDWSQNSVAWSREDPGISPSARFSPMQDPTMLPPVPSRGPRCMQD